ncbi:MAG: DUF502 domain-containing protein [Thermogutta sp.]
MHTEVAHTGDVPSNVVRKPSPFDPFFKAVWRGAATILPPLITFVIIIWVVTTINQYIFSPLTRGVRDLILVSTADIVPGSAVPPSQPKNSEIVLQNKTYVRTKGGAYIPKDVAEYVREEVGNENLPSTAIEVYRVFIEHRYLKPHLILPFLVAILILILYLIGKIVTVRIGRIAWAQIESLFSSLPFVRSVYGAVKQVSDFVLAQRSLEFSRVVGVEWPRRGMWVIGLVTSESFPQLEKRAGREMLSVFIPTSPAPMTGFTVNVSADDTVDLGISIDQAIQFIVSCGVVVPIPSASGVSAVATDPRAAPPGPMLNSSEDD